MSFPGQEKMDDPALLSRLVYIYIYVLRPAEKKCVISSMIKFWIIESMHTTTAVIRAQTCLGPHVQRVLTHP